MNLRNAHRAGSGETAGKPGTGAADRGGLAADVKHEADVAGAGSQQPGRRPAPVWDGRKEHPVKGTQLALLSGVIAALISAEGVRRSWHSPALDVAADLGVPWTVPALAAALAALGSFTWAEAWRYGKRLTKERTGPRADHGVPVGQGPLDRARHAALQGVSATLGAAAVLLVVPGGDGITSGNLGGGLPPVVMEEVLGYLAPPALTLLIGLSVMAGSWWGWDKFAADPIGPGDEYASELE